MKSLKFFLFLTILFGGLAVVGEGASAAPWDCSTKHCWFTGSSGGGTAKGVNDSNDTITVANVQSARNRNTSYLQMCGYFSSYGYGGTATKTGYGVTHSFSIRTIKSNRWKPVGAACS